MFQLIKDKWNVEGGIFDTDMEKELEGVNEKYILHMPRLFRRSEEG